MNHSPHLSIVSYLLLWTVSFATVVATRNLRGGSGGGGTSGGGSYYNGNDGDGADSGLIPIWVGVIGGIGSLIFAAIYLCKCRNLRRNKALFEEAVNNAKADVEQKRQATLSYERILPHSGEYTTQYLNRGTEHNGSITLTFHYKGSPDGYVLSGNGIDADGCTTITEGYANYDGTAWWKEKTTTGDVGMQVLSTGKFDFVEHSFTGEWYSDTNTKGTYIFFSAKDPPVSAPTESISSDEGKHVDIGMDPDYVSSISAAPSKY
jgi:hypothetical protein